MTARPRRQVGSWPVAAARRATPALVLAFVLPFFLLFAQQGELRHEIGHLAESTTRFQKNAPADKGHCVSCLAFGHLAGAARTESFAAALLADLAFGLVSRVAFGVASLDAPPARSRGPPHS